MGYLGSVVGVLKRVGGFKETYEELSKVFTERSSLVQDKAKEWALKKIISSKDMTDRRLVNMVRV